MPLTPETLPRHELAGLRVRVVDSVDPTQVGVKGRVVRETTRTLVIEREAASGDAGVTQVPKRGRTFEFAVDEAAEDREASGTTSEPTGRGGSADADSPTGEGVAYVTVDGDVLLSRPAERTEKGADSQWR
jgi:ribonuclease P protein subunit POP4